MQGNTDIIALGLAIAASKGGGGGETYIYTQYGSSDFWIIEHNLKKFPSVSVVDSGGTQVYGDVNYISENKLTIQFKLPFSGKAYLN